MSCGAKRDEIITRASTRGLEIPNFGGKMEESQSFGYFLKCFNIYQFLKCFLKLKCLSLKINIVGCKKKKYHLKFVFIYEVPSKI